MLGQIKHTWQAKQNAWLHKRIAPGAHLLGKRSIFILPTRQGFYLAFFLLAMLVACINYTLSLGYMLTFFVFSVAMGAMHRSHQTLLGTRLEILPCEPYFAGDNAVLKVVLSNTSRLHKHTVCLALRPASAPAHAALSTTASLAAQSAHTLEVRLPTLPRGLHPVPTLEISSSYPLGLWRAWSYGFSQDQTPIAVYPNPHAPLPPMRALVRDASATAQVLANTRDTQGDAVSHIETVETATGRSVYWPALAKGQLAQRILDNDAPTAQGVVLDLAHCTAAGMEERLSQLCAAVLHCQAGNIPFVMQLGSSNEPAQALASCDAAHVTACLHALAAYE